MRRVLAALAFALALLGLPAVAGAACTLTPDTWHEPDLSPRSNYGDPPAWAHAAYTKDALGYVHLRGFVSGGWGDDQSIFTLPDGYRPEGTEMFPPGTNSGTNENRIDVQADGAVVVHRSNSAWFSLSGIVFDTPDTTADLPFDCSGGGGGGGGGGASPDDIAYAAGTEHSDVWFLSGLVAAILPAFGLYRAVVL